MSGPTTLLSLEEKIETLFWRPPMTSWQFWREGGGEILEWAVPILAIVLLKSLPMLNRTWPTPFGQIDSDGAFAILFTLAIMQYFLWQLLMLPVEMIKAVLRDRLWAFWLTPLRALVAGLITAMALWLWR